MDKLDLQCEWRWKPASGRRVILEDCNCLAPHRYRFMEKAPVIGASAGGVQAIRALAAALPAGFSGAVLVVQHIGAHKSHLPRLLSQAGKLRACQPRAGAEGFDDQGAR